MSGVPVAARFAGTHVAVDVQLTGGSLLTVHAPVTTSAQLGAPITIGVRRAAGVVLATDPRNQG